MGKFTSCLPSGGVLPKIEDTKSSNEIQCVFDAIYCKMIDTFFIIDCLKWGNQDLIEYPLCMRLMKLQENIQIFTQALDSQNIKNYKSVRLVQYLPCTVDNILRCYWGPILTPFLQNEQELHA